MEQLFRFVLVRPPIRQDESLPSIDLATQSAVQTDLAGAETTQDPRSARRKVARAFVASPDFLGSADQLGLHAELDALARELDRLGEEEAVSHAEVVTAVEAAFGRKPPALVRDGSLAAAAQALKDSIVVIKLLPEEHYRPLELLAGQLRDLEVVLKTAEDSAFPGTGAVLRHYRKRSFRLPEPLTPGSVLGSTAETEARAQQRQDAEEARRAEATDLLARYRRLERAVERLSSLSSRLLGSPQQSHPGFLAPVAVRPVQILTSELGLHGQREQWALFRQAATAGGLDPEQESGAWTTTAADGIRALSPKAGLIRGSVAFTPGQIAEVGFRVDPQATVGLDPETQEVLKERGLELSGQPLDRLVQVLRSELTSLGETLDALLGRPMQRSVKRLGNTLVVTSTAQASVWNDIVVSGHPGLPPLPPLPGEVPVSHGSINPAGVADLLVVKQQLVRYEAADVAHVENVLKGERKTREHSRRTETESFTLRESEVTTTEEREHESTTRFEMSKETAATLRADASLKAGLTVSGSYGPTVDFAASVEGAVSRSKEESTKAAATFSQDVTDRSASKITERVLERSTKRVTDEVIERNTHALDNREGAAHISGVYQWVEKVYQAQVFNYGVRAMYDFMVPEPAAFLIASLEGAHATATELAKPTPWTLRPDQVTEANYSGWVREYGATDVQVPPADFVTAAHDFNANAEDENVEFTHSAQIAVADGYRAVYATVGCVRTVWEGEAVVDVVLGARSHRFTSGDWVWGTPLGGETGAVPFALVTDLVGDVAVAVEVKCQRTEQALLKWRLDTHARLTQAYRARLAEYEEKLAALEVQAGVAIQGRNPRANTELMNDELKRLCISVMTEQHFDLFGAVRTGSHGVPEIDLAENAAEGPYVRFFEQAFEWEQMTWVTYPYFWGRKSAWVERIAYEDSDPLFQQFLKAGYCRVVVPARRGFEAAIDHFMRCGETWDGGPLPPISDDLYLPIADEIAERLDRPGGEVPQGEPWTVRIPTTLVHLRADDQLPAWKQDTEGEWIPA